MCQKIIDETKASNVPLGVSVESVSIFKNEIQAAHDLFRLTQAIMLDAYGADWAMTYALVGGKSVETTTTQTNTTDYAHGDNHDNALKDKIKNVLVPLGALVLGFLARRR